MKKKLFAVFLASVLALSLFAVGCSKDDGIETDPSQAVGSKANPAGQGKTVTIEVKSTEDGSAMIAITMDEVLRGKKANEFVAQASENNPKPADGKEYVVVTFTLVNRENTGSYGYFLVRSSQFSMYDHEQKAVSNSKPTLSGVSLIHADLVVDDKATGYIIFEVEKGHTNYVVFAGNVWFTIKIKP